MTEIGFRCKDCEFCGFLMYRCIKKEIKISPYDPICNEDDFKLGKGGEE